MAGKVIQDHTVKIGFNGNAVFNGINQIQNKLNSLKVPKINLGLGSGMETAGSKAGDASDKAARRLAVQKETFNSFVDAYEKQLNRILKSQSHLADGVKDELNKIRKEALDAGDALRLQELKNSFRLIKADGADIVSGFRDQQRAIRESERLTRALNDSVMNLARSYLSVFTAIEAGRAIFKAGKEMDSLKASMMATSDTAAGAAKNLEFVRMEAERLGVDIAQAAQGYAKIGAVTKSLGLDTDTTREIFSAAAEASRTFGLNAERTKLVMLGFSQALSKGKLSAQELRQQIGEQIPIALQAAEKALGVTTQEFNKMLDTGSILSKDFMPKFAKQLRMMVRENNALEKSTEKVQAAQSRMHNQFVELSEAMFNAGGASVIKGVFDTLGDTMMILKAAFQGLSLALSPISWLINSINDAFGLAEDQFNTVSFAIKVIVILLIQRLIPSLKASGVAGTQAAIGVRLFGQALLFAAGAAKQLMKALFIGFAFEGIGWALDKFVYNNNSGTSSGSSGGQSTTNQTVNISIDASAASAQDVALEVQRSMGEQLSLNTTR